MHIDSGFAYSHIICTHYIHTLHVFTVCTHVFTHYMYSQYVHMTSTQGAKRDAYAMAAHLLTIGCYHLYAQTKTGMCVLMTTAPCTCMSDIQPTTTAPVHNFPPCPPNHIPPLTHPLTPSPNTPPHPTPSPTHYTPGVAPDEAYVDLSAGGHGKMVYSVTKSVMRPEVVESIWYMWRLTGNPKYRRWGWRIFTSYDRYQ